MRDSTWCTKARAGVAFDLYVSFLSSLLCGHLHVQPHNPYLGMRSCCFSTLYLLICPLYLELPAPHLVPSSHPYHISILTDLNRVTLHLGSQPQLSKCPSPTRLCHHLASPSMTFRLQSLLLDQWLSNLAVLKIALH